MNKYTLDFEVPEKLDGETIQVLKEDVVRVLDSFGVRYGADFKISVNREDSCLTYRKKTGNDTSMT